MITLGRKELITIFKSELKNSSSYIYLDGDNPCHIMYDGNEFYVYVKNISPAYFTNPDVSRVQLTGVDILNQIKETDAIFILIGYDPDNDVYATWNPHTVKQRIGTAASPSLYSRFTWQVETGKCGKFMSHDLKNDGEVLLFPRKRICEFMDHIDQYFPDTSEYVAMGSKRRKEANAAYKEFTSSKNIREFALYEAQNDTFEEFDLYSEEEIRRAVENVFVFISPQITKNRKLFYSCNSLAGYVDALNKFFDLDDLKFIDDHQMYLIRYVIYTYMVYLLDKFYDLDDNDDDIDDNIDCEENPAFEISDKKNEDSNRNNRDRKDNELMVIDYETKYIDSNGILTKITNPELIELLREDLHTEYPNIMSAYNTIDDFYGERFPNMEMKHWQKAFESIDWDNPTQDSINDDVYESGSNRQKIKVVYPDGRVVCHNVVVKTLIDVVEYAGVDKVIGLNLTTGKNGGMELITEAIPTSYKYDSGFKELSNGWFLNTKTDTQAKFVQVKKINDGLNLGLDVRLV